jgi:protein-disulfide isomerase
MEEEIQLQPVDGQVDHVRGPAGAGEILVYGDYECPYTRLAMRGIEAVQGGGEEVRFVFRHFPLSEIHPHALAAALAAEAAAAQGRFWEMHDLLFHRQHALTDRDLSAYAGELALDLRRFEEDRSGDRALGRIRRDLESGLAAGVQGTPGIFIDAEPYAGAYDAAALGEALRGA